MTDRMVYEYPVRAWIGVSIFLAISTFGLWVISFFLCEQAAFVLATACGLGGFFMIFIWISVLSSMPKIEIDENGISASRIFSKRIYIPWKDIYLFKKEKPDAFGGRRNILYYSIYTRSENEVSRNAKLNKVLSFSNALGKLKFFLERMEQMSERHGFRLEL